MTIEPAPAEIVHPVPKRLLAGGDIPKPFVASLNEYKAKWEESVKDPKKFFGNVCIDHKALYMCVHISHSLVFLSLLVNCCLGQSHLKLLLAVALLMVMLPGF